MSGIWHRNIGLSIFGESHGDLVGITVSGIKPGLRIDKAFIQSELNRRKPGGSPLSTPRQEDDELNIASGVFKGYTTGAPITLIIENNNTRSRDYGQVENKFRPGHSDYPAHIKYKGYNDFRGSGHFSGRLTAGIVFAGALAKSILKTMDIQVGSAITQIGSVVDEKVGFESMNAGLIERLHSKPLPVLDDKLIEKMTNEVLLAKSKENSIGGKIQCFAVNLPPGLGSPFFDSFESCLSHLMFSIPAVKGIEFGDGFDMASMTGLEANDTYYKQGEKVMTKSNHNGGILGGITTGMPLDFSLVIKATPSISLAQDTVGKDNFEETKIEVQGRHDPCIIPRALPVVEAMAAITILDFIYDN